MQLLIFSFGNDSYRLGVMAYHSSLLVGSNGLFNYLVASQPSSQPILAISLSRNWWAQMDSDHRPHAYQACALTS